MIQTNKTDTELRPFKVCDSSSAYCCVLDIYVGKTDDGTKPSKFGKTHDLIMKLLASYLNKGYVIHSFIFILQFANTQNPCMWPCSPSKSFAAGNSFSKIQSSQ